MTTAVRFEQVSKKYRLGAGTTSLRDALPHALSRLFRRRASNGKGDSIIWALKDVSFALEKGQALGIIGPNGAGKTTILKLLSNISRPTRGTIDADGRVSALIELGAGFHLDLTGRENLYLNAAILGISRQEMATKFDSIVDFSGLSDFMDTPVKRYSSGMYVRLGFSVAAHVEPDVLLVDEVLAVGDASFRRRCIERIHDLRERGTTIVFVSHNMNLVRSVCDKGLFLLGGQVEAFGSALDAIRAYEAFLRGQQTKAAVPLNRTHEMLKAGDVPIEILAIELLKDGNRVTKHLFYTDNVRVRVSYRARERVYAPSLLVRIIRSDGMTCCELRTSNYGVSLPDLEGSGSFDFSIEPLQLASGAYIIEVWVRNVGGGAVLATGQSDWFQVTGHGVTVEYELGGVYVPRVRWDFAANRQPVERNEFFPGTGGDG